MSKESYNQQGPFKSFCSQAMHLLFDESKIVSTRNRHFAVSQPKCANESTQIRAQGRLHSTRRSRRVYGIRRHLRNIGCVQFNRDGYILYVAFEACVYAEVAGYQPMTIHHPRVKDDSAHARSLRRRSALVAEKTRPKCAK